MNIIYILLLFFVGACSSSPKNPGEIYNLRKQAEGQLDEGNKTADRGSYENALILLNEAKRLAIIADDPGLRIRAGLSQANVLFSLGQREEAAAGWQASLDEAENLGDRELIALSRIHIVRGKMLSAARPADIAQSVRDEVNREIGALKDQLNMAFAWTVIGFAEKELGRYGEAEAAVKRSLAIHEKDRYFEQAAYDWFFIASIRSLAKNYEGARQALEAAITLDRRIENSWGLAADWRALGDIHAKAGKNEEARRAYLRSIEIFRSLGNDDAAAETEQRMNGIDKE
ncbi:MAG: tetratricopeptide repeat protein [Treponema sp.]|jgi:tetratricopeptide (TPR) repeat protein|nr:tetratricopeptide repeat protein [Treponema sp.]